jgi:hypothetical protein
MEVPRVRRKIFVGFIEQPGIVDIQYMAQNSSRKNADSIIVFNLPPAGNVTDMANQQGVQLIQAEDIAGKAKELETHYKAAGFTVKLRNLLDIRDMMRDVC